MDGAPKRLTARASIAAASLACAFLISTMPAARAQAGNDQAGNDQAGNGLYTATTIVTGTDMRSRPVGLARCLTEVIVKLTGNPALAGDARVRDLADHADAYVVGFSYYDPMNKRRPHDDQGTYDRSYDLTVRFDPAKLDAALGRLGARPWRGERPVIVPVLAMRGSDPPWRISLVLTDGDPASAVQRAAFANAAAKYGVTVRFPGADEVRAWGATPDRAPESWDVPPSAGLTAVGAIEFRPAALGWVGSWRTQWQGASHGTEVRGVGFDEAFDKLVRDAVRLASGQGAPD